MPLPDPRPVTCRECQYVSPFDRSRRYGDCHALPPDHRGKRDETPERNGNCAFGLHRLSPPQGPPITCSQCKNFIAPNACKGVPYDVKGRRPRIDDPAGTTCSLREQRDGGIEPGTEI